MAVVQRNMKVWGRKISLSRLSFQGKDISAQVKALGERRATSTVAEREKTKARASDGGCGECRIAG